jgi:hypothetical protein
MDLISAVKTNKANIVANAIKQDYNATDLQQSLYFAFRDCPIIVGFCVGYYS